MQGLEGSWSGPCGQDRRARIADAPKIPSTSTTTPTFVRRARRFASLTVNRSIAGWRVGGEWIVSGRARATAVGKLGGYGVVNLSGALQHHESLVRGAQIQQSVEQGL